MFEIHKTNELLFIWRITQFVFVDQKILENMSKFLGNRCESEKSTCVIFGNCHLKQYNL